ncbi:UNVERIFIED_CONTAM: hypothetical protein HDU68_012593 [Siphonaria sp. JEL0065]|nr:hypothetical protein HDU68_012593 [Siphonaria sp. JEL0065]
MMVIEVDGIRVEPYEVDALTIKVAQRYSVLVKANQTPGKYLIHGKMLPESDMPAGFNPNVTAILDYAGVAVDQPPITTGVYSVPEPSKTLDFMKLKPFQKVLVPEPGPNDLTLLFEFEFMAWSADAYQKAYVATSSREFL